MGTMEDLTKSKEKQSTLQPSAVKKQKNWLKYNLLKETEKRELSRKLLYITTLLNDIGYPIKTCYSINTLKGMGDESVLEVNDKDLSTSGIIEFLRIDDNIKEEILKFLSSKNILVYQVFNYQYKDKMETTRFVVQITSIKEGK